MRAGAAAWAEAIETLRLRFGERISTTEAIRQAHGRGEGVIKTFAPSAVAWPESTDEVAAMVSICAAHDTPVIAFGAGTSLEGQVQAVNGGVCIDLTRMRRLLEVSAADLDCRVEAGLDREGLNALLKGDGLFFPLDPGANATLGGMAATRASGTNAVRYGTMREATLGLTVVTAAGQVMRLGGRARKSAAGYDLVRLFVGSEGTLGVITELQLRLFGIPEVIAAAVCQFETLRGAVEAVCAISQAGVPIARIELLDQLQMRACITYSKLKEMAAKPTLFMEFHGSSCSVTDQIAQVETTVAEFGGTPLRHARTPEQRSALWRARHNAYHAGRSLRPGSESIATDACVPISALPDCLLAAEAMASEAGLICPIVGHVGDGNFHLLVLFDPASRAEQAKAEALALGVARLALAFGGTISGEHGVGVHKRGLMREEHGAAVDLMRAIKHAFDPSGIMNPGKMLPE
ncbi:D-lactate dehydrogenase [alpha proteobacterium U9-1i]|nr:D-lactate dehydrogenase [alpha proteobacterium U9-1i]